MEKRKEVNVLFDHSDSEMKPAAATWATLFQLAAMVLLYEPSDRQDSTYHILCYTSCEALAGMRNSSMVLHEGSIHR